jgi:hypothetical protein
MQAMGFTRNLGGPVISAERKPDRGEPVNTSRCPFWKALLQGGSKQEGAIAVSEGEGNEAQGEGWQGVGASKSTEEAGEPTRRDPVEGRGRHIRGALGGKDARYIET